MKTILLSISLIFLVGTARLHGQDLPKWKLRDLEAAIKNADRPTVFNFWATFCKPCVAEIPYFQQLVKQYDSAGVRLVLVSLDLPEAYPKKITSFAAQHNFKSPITWLDESNADLFCPVVDPSWSGAIPASLFVNNATHYRKFFEDQLDRVKFEKELKALIAVRHQAAQ